MAGITFRPMEILPRENPSKHFPSLQRLNPQEKPCSSSVHESPHETLLMFHQVLYDGTPSPNHLTFPSLFKACRRLRAIREGRQLHAQAIKRGSHRDFLVQVDLIRMYAKCLACQDALTLFVRCPEPTIISKNDLIAGLVRSGDLHSARKVFDGMMDKNDVTWSIMIDGYARNGDMESAQVLFDVMPERNQFSCSSLLTGYLKHGCVEVARKIFDEMMPERGVITWTALISGYTQNHLYKEALDLFLQMQISGMAPNTITLISILPAVSQLGALSLGRWIHAYADQKRIQLGHPLGSALVDMYSKCGCIADALVIFERLNRKEVSAWNSIILGLASHGRGKDALGCFSRMLKDLSVIPNEITFVGVLSACSHAGLVDEGYHVFNLLTNYYKLTPDIRHYGCMVDLLGRAGLLDEAMKFIEKMPMEPNSVICKILLSACRVHMNAELAKHISSKLMEFGPKDSGFYTLLSNIYNEAGLDDAACSVRKEMNDLEVTKVAGCSWIEVDGVVHEFSMGR